VESGVITGGMLPKVEAASRALERVKRVHIIDGCEPHALVRELFTDKGVGTMVVRSARLPALLALSQTYAPLLPQKAHQYSPFGRAAGNITGGMLARVASVPVGRAVNSPANAWETQGAAGDLGEINAGSRKSAGHRRAVAERVAGDAHRAPRRLDLAFRGWLYQAGKLRESAVSVRSAPGIQGEILRRLLPRAGAGGYVQIDASGVTGGPRWLLGSSRLPQTWVDQRPGHEPARRG